MVRFLHHRELVIHCNTPVQIRNAVSTTKTNVFFLIPPLFFRATELFSGAHWATAIPEMLYDYRKQNSMKRVYRRLILHYILTEQHQVFRIIYLIIFMYSEIMFPYLSHLVRRIRYHRVRSLSKRLAEVCILIDNHAEKFMFRTVPNEGFTSLSTANIFPASWSRSVAPAGVCVLVISFMSFTLSVVHPLVVHTYLRYPDDSVHLETSAVLT